MRGDLIEFISNIDKFVNTLINLRYEQGGRGHTKADYTLGNFTRDRVGIPTAPLLFSRQPFIPFAAVSVMTNPEWPPPT